MFTYSLCASPPNPPNLFSVGIFICKHLKETATLKSYKQTSTTYHFLAGVCPLNSWKTFLAFFWGGVKSHWQFCLKVCLCLSVSGHHGWIVYREGRDIQRCREPGNHAGNKYYISLVQHFVGQFGNICQNKQCTRLLGLFSPMFKYTYLLVCSSKIHIRVQ